jgi:hypothetical protein
MSERLNKTSICSVVFLDIVNQSKKPVAEQIKDKDLFNGFINEAIKDVAQNDRILLDTGDGAAIALLGAPEEALFVAMTIRDSIMKYNKDSKDKLSVRTGINLGPVRVVSDINGRPNILGDGINVAERVMSFAGPDQILVSRSYYEITSRLTEEITGMFSYFGIRQDKHVREHEVYSIRSSDEEPFVPESQTEPAAAASASLFSRLLNHENLSRYGLWGSMALVAIAISAGAIMLVNNMLTPPDLGNVVAEIPAPGGTAAALQTGPSAAASETTMQPDAPVLKAVAPVMAKPGDADKTAANQPSTTTAKAATPKRKSTKSAKKQEPVKDVAAPAEETTMAVAPVENEPAVEEQKEPTSGEQKSGWSAFKESLKKGREERVCTQAEIALNQCR